MPTSRRELEVKLADHYERAVRFEDAEQVFVGGIVDRTEQFSSGDHVQVALAQLRFGTFLIQHDRFGRAEELLLDAHERLSNNPNSASATVERVAVQLVRLYTAWQKPTEAANWQSKLDELTEGSDGRVPL